MNDQVNMDELARQVNQVQNHPDLTFHNTLTEELEETLKKEAATQCDLDQTVNEIRKLEEVIAAQKSIDARQHQAAHARARLKSMRRHIATMKDEIDLANGGLL
jgi:polyhydroxyalkanoate synthesis regulator phasin